MSANKFESQTTDAIYLTASAGCLISSNKCDSTGRYDVLLSTSIGCNVSSNFFNDTTNNNIQITDSDGSFVSSNFFDNGGARGVYCDSSPNVSVHNNTFRNQSNNCLYTEASSGGSFNFNYIYEPPTYIVYSFASSDLLEIQGNTSYNSAGTSYLLLTDNNFSANPNDIHMSGNRLIGGFGYHVDSGSAFDITRANHLEEDSSGNHYIELSGDEAGTVFKADSTEVNDAALENGQVNPYFNGNTLVFKYRNPAGTIGYATP